MNTDTCLNGHGPEHITIRENGSRNCAKCAAEYFHKIRTYPNTRRENDKNVKAEQR